MNEPIDVADGDAQQWEIARYVLLDESLDRDDFERRMLQDERLALAVATAVEEMNLLATAGQALRRTELSGRRHQSANRSRRSLLVSAACVLLAVGLGWGIFLRSRTTDRAGQFAPMLSAIAEQWLMLDEAAEIETPHPVVFVEGTDGMSGPDSPQPAEWIPAGDDWIVDAGRAYYRELEG